MITVHATKFQSIKPKDYPDCHCMLITYNMKEVGILITGASGAMNEKIKGLAGLIDSGKPPLPQPAKKPIAVIPLDNPANDVGTIEEQEVISKDEELITTGG